MSVGKKKIGLLAAGIMLALTASVTFAVSETKAGKNETGVEESLKDKTVASVVLLDDQTEKLFQLSMKKVAEEYGATVIEDMNEGELGKEVELLNQYIEDGVDGVCIYPVSDTSSVEMLENTAKQGVKVALINSGIEADWVTVSAEIDQYHMGELVGEVCSEYIETHFPDRKANIAIIQFKALNTKTSQYRTDGFLSKTKDQINILQDIDAWNIDSSVEVIEEVIYANPDLDLIFSANEGATEGAVFAVRNTGRQIPVFGIDISEQLVNMLLDDENILQALGGQDPINLGETAMRNLCLEMIGEEYESKIVLPGVLLERSKETEALEYMNQIFEVLEEVK